MTGGYAGRIALALVTVVMTASVALGATPRPTVDGPTGAPAYDPIERLSWQVVSTTPHDPTAWTEGLVIDGAGALYESTGEYGTSSLRQVDRATGAVLRSVVLPSQLYGEGLASVDDHLIQLTWKEGVALVWDATTLAQVGSFAYQGQGWGLCFDGNRLVMSDGTPTLTFRDPDTFEVQGSVVVTVQGQPLRWLNELECVDGSVWANVWYKPWIVRIDPTTGAVTGALDTTGIITPDPSVADSGAVLNGIAYDPADGTFLLTGKRWPSMFRVRIMGPRAGP